MDTIVDDNESKKSELWDYTVYGYYYTLMDLQF